MQKISVLWISKSVPYDNVGHAGGKTHNFFLKELMKDEELSIRLVSFADYNDEWQNDHIKYGVKSDVITWPKRKSIKWFLWRMLDLETLVNPFNRYAGLTWNFEAINLLKRLKKLKRDNFVPDLIIMEWTQIILMQKEIKIIFPFAKMIGVEVDVAFLSYKRILSYKKNSFIYKYFKIRYERLKRKEINAVTNLDDIIVNNLKDANLLLANGVDNIITVIPPYFNDFSYSKRKRLNNDIIFWGAMNRPENWKSAIWFIENVMPLLSDLDLRFVVIGARPNESLVKRWNDRIQVTGFVNNTSDYFLSSFCLVAPLVLGAGIKVKVLEGLSSGIPVLANDIATEGIDVVDSVNYFRCITPKDYSDVIHNIYTNVNLGEKVGTAGRNLIKNKYNLNTAVKKFKNSIHCVINNKR